MIAIAAHFPESTYVHVHEGDKPVFPEGHPLFIDSIHLVPKRQRKRLFRRRVSFVVSTHVDVAGELSGAGVAVETLRPADWLSEKRILSIFNRRIEAARRGPGDIPRITPRTARKLINKFDNDVRSMENHLYDIFQNLEEVQDGSL